MIGVEIFPRVDDHLVEPEITRDEIIGGQRIVASPAQSPHADQHGVLQYIVQAHVRPGYTAAVHLLTRVDNESDFATDTCGDPGLSGSRPPAPVAASCRSRILR